MDTTPVLTVADHPVDRMMEKVQQLAALRPALVRLLEWELDRNSNVPRSQATPRLTPSVY